MFYTAVTALKMTYILTYCLFMLIFFDFIVKLSDVWCTHEGSKIVMEIFNYFPKLINNTGK